MAAAGGGERWSLAGATALVTGGSKGIGHAIVEELARLGARVHTCARGAADLSPPTGGRWEEKGLQATVEAAFARKLDILVNNAAQAVFKAAAECTGEDYARIMATNLESCFHLCQLAHPLLRRASIAGGGSVVNVSSVASYLGFPGIVLYSTAKGGLNQLTRSLAAEWAADKIRVNCVAPGLIMTDMSKEAGPEILQQEVWRIPLRRGSEPAEVASVVSFLCMPAASFVTDQVICIDGGRTISS